MSKFFNRGLIAVVFFSQLLKLTLFQFLDHPPPDNIFNQISVIAIVALIMPHVYDFFNGVLNFCMEHRYLPLVPRIMVGICGLVMLVAFLFLVNFFMK